MVTVHVPSWYLVPPLGVPSPAVLTFQGCVWEGGGVEGGAWFPTPPLPLPPPPFSHRHSLQQQQHRQQAPLQCRRAVPVAAPLKLRPSPFPPHRARMQTCCCTTQAGGTCQHLK